MTAAAGPPRDLKTAWSSPRQSIWARIRQLGANGTTFTCRQLWYGGHEELSTVDLVLRDLRLAGYVERVGKQHRPSSHTGNAGTETLYRLVNDIGFEAPRLTTGGRLVTAGRKTEQLWQTMRRLSHFTAPSLAIAASVDDSVINVRSANNYCVILAKASYLQVVERAIPKRRKSTVYRLIKARNTGPKAPYLRHFVEAVWDPNLGAVAWYAEEAGAPRRRRPA